MHSAMQLSKLDLREVVWRGLLGQMHLLRLLELVELQPVEDIDLRVTRQEGPGYSYGHCQKPSAKSEDGGAKMGLRPGYGLRPVVTIIIMVELVL